LRGWFPVRFQEDLDQQRVDSLGRVGDLVIALGERRTGRRELHPVQRALPRQRLGDLPLARQQSQQRVFAQLLVVIQVFVAQRQSVNPLRQHLVQLILDHLPPASTTFAQRSYARESGLFLLPINASRPPLVRNPG